jgi:ubiquitin-conjugating enzyme E2 variant
MHSTGVFHWAADNYGSGQTPVFGSVIEAFQGHHRAPWTITCRPFANNVHKICIGTIPVLTLAWLALLTHFAAPLPALFITVFLNGQVLAQELHKYAHMVQQVPAPVQALQRASIALSRKEHGLHHAEPFEGHYCILNGICNPLLDSSSFFRRLEGIVFQLTGEKPNCWKLDPELEARSR